MTFNKLSTKKQNQSSFNKGRYFFVSTILFFALIIRYLCINEIVETDSLQYLVKAFHFFETDYYVSKAHHCRIGIIFPVAVLIKIFGLSNFSVYAYNIFCSLGTVIVIYHLGKLLFNTKVGIVSAFLFTVIPSSFIWSEHVLPGTIITFYSSLAVLLFYLGIHSTKNIPALTYFTLCGVCAGISYLTRVTGAYIIIVLIALCLFNIYSKNKLFKFNLSFIPIIVFVFIIIVEGMIYKYFFDDFLLRWKMILALRDSWITGFAKYQASKQQYFALKGIFHTGPAYYLSPKSGLFPIYWFTIIVSCFYLVCGTVKKIAVPLIWLSILVILIGYSGFKMHSYSERFLLVTLVPSVLISSYGINSLYDKLHHRKNVLVFALLPVLIVAVFNFMNFQFNLSNHYSLEHRLQHRLLGLDFPKENSVIYSDDRTIAYLNFYNKYKPFPFVLKTLGAFSSDTSQNYVDKYILINWNIMNWTKKAYGSDYHGIVKNLSDYKKVFEVKFFDLNIFSFEERVKYKAELFSVN